MVIYDIVSIIGPLFTHFGLVSCLCLNQWPLAFLMTPLDWTMSCHVLIMDSSWMMDVVENITGELTNSFVEWTTSAAYILTTQILTTYILTKRTDSFI